MKKCIHCNKLKSLEEYNKKSNAKDGHSSICKSCSKKANKKWREINKDYANKKTREWRKKNKKKVKKNNTEYYKQYGDDLREKQKVRDKMYRTTKKLDLLYRQRKMFWQAKYRAKKKKIKFNINYQDVVFPKVCPVLKFKIDYKGKRNAYNIPSLDRIDSKKGYIKGNVRVISNRANFLKNNATADELMKVAKDLKKLGI